MKGFKSIIVTFASIAFSISCTEDAPVVEYLDVTPNNISGSWELVEWNGKELDEDTYFYIDFVRKDRGFILYQNFDSIGDAAHKITGTFNIEIDVELGAVIRGLYDYDGGFWSHEYEVNNLTQTTMEWVAVDDNTFVQKFVRISAIPEDIKGTDE